MFEKEAEEYIKTNNLEWELECNRTSPIGEVNQAYQKGAEFGYNKAKEWHYVKDGDLPKEFDKPYLCYVNGHFEVGYFMAYKEQPWHFDEYYLDNEDVIAWCEIPKYTDKE
jgi:hypothetical protein